MTAVEASNLLVAGDSCLAQERRDGLLVGRADRGVRCRWRVAGQDGHPDFDRLMGRMRAETWQRVQWEQRQVPVTFVAFDLLFLDGEDLRRRPLL